MYRPPDFDQQLKQFFIWLFFVVAMSSFEHARMVRSVMDLAVYIIAPIFFYLFVFLYDIEASLDDWEKKRDKEED